MVAAGSATVLALCLGPRLRKAYGRSADAFAADAGCFSVREAYAGAATAPLTAYAVR
jgi:hypothetical protein